MDTQRRYITRVTKNRLGQVSNEDYRRAADVASATGETLPTGREFAPDEISD